MFCVCRWSVSIDHSQYLGLRQAHKHLTMNNYLGFGCGASVALDFHETRQSYPSLFSSRIINKVTTRTHACTHRRTHRLVVYCTPNLLIVRSQAWYLGLGAKDVLQQSCKNLHEKIEVHVIKLRSSYINYLLKL